MLYYVGDSWHTQNIQIINLLVEMKNVSFILWKNLYELFGQPNICLVLSVVFALERLTGYFLDIITSNKNGAIRMRNEAN